MPPVSKADITDVLVRLRNDVQIDAAKLLSGVRESMYSGTLAHYFKGIGDAEFLPELRTMITQAVDSIATQAGIDLDVLHTATLTADGKVQLQKEKEQATVGAAGARSRAEIKGEGETSARTDIGARELFEDEAHAKIAAAPGTFDPANILLHRDALIRRVLRRLAPEDLRHEREGTERQNALTMLEGAYMAAYRTVAEDVAKRIQKDTEAASGPKAKSVKVDRPVALQQAPAPTSAQAPTPAPSAAPATPAEAWAQARWEEVRRAFADLRTQAEQSTKGNRGKVFAARWRSGELIRDWADRQVGDRVGDYERVMERLRSWGKERETASKVWEEARLASLYVDLQGDLTFVGELEADAGRRAQAKAMGDAKMLSKAQQAIVDEYFAKGPPRDPLSAVAAGMRARITEARAPRLKEQLDAMLYKQPPDNWDPVAKVAESEGGDVVIKERGDKFWAAVDQWGTDEDKVYASLTGLTKLQRFALDLWYQKKHGSTIEAELKDEMEDEELDRAKALLEGDEVAAAAAAIRDAIVGPGTDEELIYSQLRNKTKEQRDQIEAIYLSRYKVSLTKDLEADLGGEELARAKALQVGDVKRADAIGLEYAKSSKWYGGPDTDAIQKIYAENRSELENEAKAQRWTADQLRDKILARNADIDAEHKREYKGQGLRASFETGLRGPARDLALGLHDQDWKKADAARLELERRSFITDDKVVNQILESQYTRARKEITLDKEHDLAYRRDLAMLRGEAKLWDEKKQRADMTATIDKESKARGVEYMNDLKATYDTAYQDDPIYKVNGRGGFDNLINDHLMGSDKDRAKALVAGGGHLTPVQELQFAVQGAGTNLDVVKQQLAGKSPKEIEQLERDWQLLHKDDEPQPYPTLRSRVMEEVSGRDAFDVDLLLEGEPQNPQAKLERAKKKRDYEKSAYLLGNTFSEEEAGELDEEVAKLEKTVQRLHNLEGLGVLTEAQTKEADLLRWEVDQRVRSVDSAVEEHRRSVDWLADTIAMVAAVAVGILVTAVTGGLAGLVLGAIAAAEATVLAKLAVKGGAYTDEELLVDVATGVVDAVLAIPTAKMGGLLLRTAAKGMPIGPLAKLATSASRTKRMIAHGLQNSVEGFLGGVASGTVGALADERTWNNPDVLGNVAAAGGMGGLMGAGMGGGIGMLGGVKGYKGPRLDPGRPPDLDAAAKAFDEAQRAGAGLDDQGARQARAAQWQAHQEQHPSSSYADFLVDLEAGRIAPDPAGAAAFGRAARDALVSGLPPVDRGVLDGVAVQVLGDTEFSRMTRSDSGQAVTIVRDGKPVVLMRESAPIRALREEGIHAAQVLDPRFAVQTKLLDESMMARWGSLDLKTRMDMYRAKLDLELDAHAKLLKGLLNQIDETPPGLARNALADQADAARRNMANLADRRVELDSFGPLDRLAARFGRGRLALRLEQPPRLFAKTPTLRKAPRRTGPRVPERVEEKRQLVGELRRQIEGIETGARERGRPLSDAEVKHLELLRERLRAQYQPVPAKAAREQEAVLFDRRLDEQPEDYLRRLLSLRDEVMENVLATENWDLFDRYERLLLRVAADDVRLKGLRDTLAEVKTKQREKAIEINKVDQELAAVDRVTRREKAIEIGKELPAEGRLTRQELLAKRKQLVLEDANLMTRERELLPKIRGIEQRGSLLHGDKFWKSLVLVDPTDTRIRTKIGVAGELDAVDKLVHKHGFERMGKTVDPDAVTSPEAFDAAVKQREGQQGIDISMKRERPDGAIEYVLGDAKATAEVSPKTPQGAGRLKTMSSDEEIQQLGMEWLKRHLPNSQLSERDLRNLTEALAEAIKNPGKPVTVKHPDGTTTSSSFSVSTRRRSRTRTARWSRGSSSWWATRCRSERRGARDREAGPDAGGVLRRRRGRLARLGGGCQRPDAGTGRRTDPRAMDQGRRDADVLGQSGHRASGSRGRRAANDRRPAAGARRRRCDRAGACRRRRCRGRVARRHRARTARRPGGAAGPGAARRARATEPAWLGPDARCTADRAGRPGHRGRPDRGTTRHARPGPGPRSASAGVRTPTGAESLSSPNHPHDRARVLEVVRAGLVDDDWEVRWTAVLGAHDRHLSELLLPIRRCHAGLTGASVLSWKHCATSSATGWPGPGRPSPARIASRHCWTTAPVEYDAAFLLVRVLRDPLPDARRSDSCRLHAGACGSSLARPRRDGSPTGGARVFVRHCDQPGPRRSV